MSRYRVSFEDVNEIPRQTFYMDVNAENSQEARRKFFKKATRMGLERKDLIVISAKKVKRR